MKALSSLPPEKSPLSGWAEKQSVLEGVSPFPCGRMNGCLCFPRVLEEEAGCVGSSARPAKPPAPWLTALRARGLVSPETGLNGSSNSALALPHWKAEPDKGRHCVLLQRPRGRPSMGPQTGTRPGSRPCNSRQASALRGKKKTFLCPPDSRNSCTRRRRLSLSARTCTATTTSALAASHRNYRAES